jgi:hypothetical protein
VLEESTLKITGLPEAPPVAVGVYEAPNSAGVGGLELNTIVCGRCDELDRTKCPLLSTATQTDVVAHDTDVK